MSLPWPDIDGALGAARPIRLSGRVMRSSGMVVEGTLPGARLGMLCRLMIRGRPEGVPAEIIDVQAGRVTLMPLGDVPGISVGSRIEPVSLDQTIPIGDAVVGRVIDGLGQPIDGGPPIHAHHRQPLHPPVVNPMLRGTVDDVLPLGIAAIDGMLTCGEGQRLVIMAGAGVGKSTLMAMMTRNTEADVTVLALIGERSREVKLFVERELGEEGLRRATVVAATSNTSPALRLRAAFVATAIAEYFAERGKRVLLLMDSLTRVAEAQKEIGLALDELPGRGGNPVSALRIVPKLVERAGPGTGGGSITAFYTALLSGDDTNDPVGDYIRASTDGHIVLSRALAEQGHFPAIDVPASVSRVMGDIVDDDQKLASRSVRRLLADLREANEMRAMGAYAPGENPYFDRVLPLERQVRELLTQGPHDVRPRADSLAKLEALATRYEALVEASDEAAVAAAAASAGGAGEGTR